MVQAIVAPMLDNQKLKLEGAQALERKLKARPMALLLLVVSLGFILTACNNTNETSTALSNTVVANQQAGGIKQLPPQPAADTPAPAQTTIARRPHSQKRGYHQRPNTQQSSSPDAEVPSQPNFRCRFG